MLMPVCRIAACLAAVSSLLAAPALAAGACPMTYAQYEFAIPHIDLETCPDGVAPNVPGGVFCRASVANDQVHVFVFALEGDQCLVAMDSRDEDAFDLTLR